MPGEKICKRCHSELEIKCIEYGSYSGYICPVCHKEYSKNSIEDPITIKDLITILFYLLLITAIPAALVIFAHYYLSVYQAAVFILGKYIGILLLILLVIKAGAPFFCVKF